MMYLEVSVAFRIDAVILEHYALSTADENIHMQNQRTVWDMSQGVDWVD